MDNAIHIEYNFDCIYLGVILKKKNCYRELRILKMFPCFPSDDPFRQPVG